jgi:hypothetical protein
VNREILTIRNSLRIVEQPQAFLHGAMREQALQHAAPQGRPQLNRNYPNCDPIAADKPAIGGTDFFLAENALQRLSVSLTGPRARPFATSKYPCNLLKSNSIHVGPDFALKVHPHFRAN